MLTLHTHFIRRRNRIRTASSISSILLTLVVLITLSSIMTVSVASFQVIGCCRMTVTATATAAANEPRKFSGLYQSSIPIQSSVDMNSSIPEATAVAATATTTTTKFTNKNKLGRLLFPPQKQQKSRHDEKTATSFPFFATTVNHDNAKDKDKDSDSDSDSDSDTVVDDAEADYQRRKAAWAARYTSVDALRSTFGSNRNLVWGDLDAATARRLYKTLLPKALLELYNTGVGVHPADLAPLAYQARVAAKLYARERCALPARVAANLYDGFRQWRKYGSFDMAGMSYQQVWNKYAASVLDEYGVADADADCDVSESSHDAADGLDERDVTAKICLKILERSCETNQMIDKWVLSSKDNTGTDTSTDNNSSRGSNYNNNSPSKALSFRKKRAAMAQRRDLQEVTDQLEHDVRQLLLLSTTTKKTGSGSSGGESRGDNKKNKSIRSGGDDGGDDDDSAEQAAGSIKLPSSLSVQRFRLLRILARSKRRIEAMQQLNNSNTAADAETDDVHNHQKHAISMDDSNDHEEQDNDFKLPWKDRPRQTTNRRKQWIERDASTIQRRP